MPATTSLGIIYPCSGDTIDCSIFQDNADSIQDALDATQALVDAALNPATVFVRTEPGQAIAAGASTTLTYQLEIWDTAAMFTLASPTLITITDPGTYLVNCQVDSAGSFTTQTSIRAAILVNGVEMSYNKFDGGTGTTGGGEPFFVSAMLPSLIAGDQITTTHLFTGTGNDSVRHQVTAIKISSV